MKWPTGDWTVLSAGRGVVGGGACTGAGRAPWRAAGASSGAAGGGARLYCFPPALLGGRDLRASAWPW